MIVFQLIYFCVIFTLMVALSVKGGAINAVYFYPREVQERAIEIGLTDEGTIKRKKRSFMLLFYIVMAAILFMIIGLWNRVSDFKTAYLQALLFLQVMNWYDGIVIDKLWVGHSRFWVIPGTEDIPYIQTWRQVCKKRTFMSLIWFAGAAIVAGMIVFIL